MALFLLTNILVVMHVYLL